MMSMSDLSPAEQAVVHILHRQLQWSYPEPLPGALESDKGRTLGDWAQEIVAAVLASETPEEALPETTPRGFRYTEIPFRDYRGTPERNLSVQESSSASEPKLWVGFDTVHVDLNGDGTQTLMERGHLDEETVRKLRDALTAWLEA